jgi:Fur family transcriptional regulator, ferric uptake regulator
MTQESQSPQQRGAPATRTTRQRTAIEALLATTSGFTSAQDLHASLAAQGSSVGLSTVYRTLQAMADAGEVDVLRQESGEALYRRCSPRHHHHLVCRECGRTVEVEGRDVETWASRVAETHGFTDPTHDVEIFGTCPDCGS